MGRTVEELFYSLILIAEFIKVEAADLLVL